MDLLNGVSFSKGCYVGQEVVSRMEHRGIARTRTVAVSVTGEVPAPGTEIMVGEKTVGTLGSAANGRAVAMVRTDRVKSALGEGLSLTAGETIITPAAIDWADFGLSGDA
jgi:folate-binding Fe-S cluster repair protein YgfZ